ncbi:MAG: hypothetical protein H0T84_10895 [Tatlockia sp.]|nr:hypothetical protein [Tatlockia sp.]
MQTKYENITILGKTVAEFNNQYKDQFSIIKADDIVLKGFWLAIDLKGNECGMFSLSKNNELIETEYSLGQYDFINRCDSLDKVSTPNHTILAMLSNPLDEIQVTPSAPYNLFKNENFFELRPKNKRTPEISQKVPSSSNFFCSNNVENKSNKSKYIQFRIRKCIEIFETI